MAIIITGCSISDIVTADGERLEVFKELVVNGTIEFETCIMEPVDIEELHEWCGFNSIKQYYECEDGWVDVVFH